MEIRRLPWCPRSRASSSPGRPDSSTTVSGILDRPVCAGRWPAKSGRPLWRVQRQKMAPWRGHFPL